MKSVFFKIAVMSVLTFSVPIIAEANVFGRIPNTMDSEGSSSQRSGEWSYRSFGILGDGYTDNGDEDNGTDNDNDSTINNDSPFGPIPSYMGSEPFGYIPTLSDLLGD